PLVPVTPPPAELAPPPPPAWMPSISEWDGWQRAEQVRSTPPRKPHGRQPAPADSRAGAIVKPPGGSVMVRYPYKPGVIYEVHRSPTSPVYMILPAGERLAAPPAVNPDAWVVGLAQMGKEATRQEAVVVRPVQATQPDAITGLLFQSGLMLFCKLRAFDQATM